MKIVLSSTGAAQTPCDVLAIPVFAEERNEKKERSPALAAADAALGGLLGRAAAEEKFEGKADQALSVHTHGDLPARRVLLVGLGPRARYDAEALRKAAGRAVRSAQAHRSRSVAIALPESRDQAPFVRAAAEGFRLGAYRFRRYKTVDRDEAPAEIQAGQILVPRGADKDPHYRAALELGDRVAEATNWARDLVNEPAMTVTPTRLAEAASDLAARAGLKCRVVGRKEIERLKMGLFLGVTRGSAEEPKLIQMAYEPDGARAKKARPVAFVGKAITFDSGGLSLKSADAMVDMKTDMAGAAAAFAAMRVVAHLEPPFPVHTFVGACENMPGGRAYKPGDVLVSRAGKTVEVINTDAEGRLVLGDVLTLAAEHDPQVVLDLATLTGACMVALGHYIVGVFGDHEETVQQVLEAGRSAGEDLWQLPISEHQRDQIKSDIADLKNSGERWGGAINAALFLKEFVGDRPWAHLDIAGPSTAPKEQGYFVKGATGVGVRTLVEFVRRRS